MNQIGDVAASLDFVFGYGCGSIGFGDIGSSFLGSDGGPMAVAMAMHPMQQ